MTCPNERRLFAVHTGDGTAADRAHAATCAACGARVRAMARDLGRIDAVLRETAPDLHRPRRAAISWLAPPAVAAALVLAVALGRRTPTATDAWPNGPDAYALADEVATLVATAGTLDDDTTDTTATTSTCAWGDPLLGVGCDEPAVMQIAWR